MLMKTPPEEIIELDECMHNFKTMLEDFTRTLHRANAAGVDLETQNEYVKQFVQITMQTMPANLASQIRQTFVENPTIPGHWVDVIGATTEEKSRQASNG